MKTIQTTSNNDSLDSLLRKNLLKLIIIVCTLVLFSCSSTPAPKLTAAQQAQKDLEDAKKARETGPLDGDVRVIDGVEWVWGRNVKYMNTPNTPLYVWLPREFYTPSLTDEIPGRVGRPVKLTKEQAELEERLAKLERAVRGESAPQSRPEQPVKDASGRTWTLYFRNDDGVQWFLDEETLQPSSGLLQMWRKRMFPQWAFQKEIVTLDEINCRQARYRTKELRVTNWNGTYQTSDKITPWANVFSGSPEAYLMDEYCKAVQRK